MRIVSLFFFSFFLAVLTQNLFFFQPEERLTHEKKISSLKIQPAGNFHSKALNEVNVFIGVPFKERVKLQFSCDFNVSVLPGYIRLPILCLLHSTYGFQSYFLSHHFLLI